MVPGAEQPRRASGPGCDTGQALGSTFATAFRCQSMGIYKVWSLGRLPRFAVP